MDKIGAKTLEKIPEDYQQLPYHNLSENLHSAAPMDINQTHTQFCLVLKTTQWAEVTNICVVAVGWS